MKTVSGIICVAALLPALASAAQTPAQATKSDPANMLFAAPTQMDRVGRIVVPVWIDGKGPFRFLVDTGADGSLVSAALAHTLQLAPSRMPAEVVEGTTGTEQMPCVTIDSLRIGSITKHNVRMPVSPSPVMTGLDGILGMAGFGSVRVLVEFRHNVVAIDRSRRDLPNDFLNIPAVRTAGGLLVVPARVGDIRVAAVIDTGAAQTLGNTALRRALLREAAAKAQDTRIYGVTTQVSNGGLARSPTVYLGPAEVSGLAIAYSDIPIFKLWHLDTQPALIIGMDALGAVDALVLDYPHDRIYLRPIAQPGISIVVDDLDHN